MGKNLTVTHAPPDNTEFLERLMFPFETALRMSLEGKNYGQYECAGDITGSPAIREIVYDSRMMIRLSATMVWIKQRTAEYRISNDEGRNRYAKSYLKQTEYIHSTFDVGRSMFISFFFNLTGRFFGQAARLNFEPFNPV